MTVNTLRKENYGIPIGVKEKIQYTPRYIGRRARASYKKAPDYYTKHYELIDDVSDCKYKPGDLALASLNPKEPAKQELVVVLDRYRVVKHKYIKFKDYMVVVMALTGPKRGKVLKRQTVRGMLLLTDNSNTIINTFVQNLLLSKIFNHEIDYFNEAFKVDIIKNLENVFKRHGATLNYVAPDEVVDE